MVRDIILDNDKRIREVSKEVERKEIGTAEFKNLCTDLVDTLNTFEYGVAISAIQIGIPKRMFLIQRKNKVGEREIPRFFINPQIISTSEKEVKMYEACLSINYAKTLGEVLRKYWVRISYLDEKGKKETMKFDGLDARIILHEMDHLDGKLFTDVVDKKTTKTLEEYLKYIKRNKRKD